jgi:hypothetical protein
MWKRLLSRLRKWWSHLFGSTTAHPKGLTMPHSRPVDTLSLTGVWWLPERADRRVAGELVLDGDEFELRLDGQLFPVELVHDKVVRVAAEWKTIPVLHGRTREDTTVTLLHCEGLILSVPEGPDTSGREGYTPQAALVGSHLDDPVLFTSAGVELDVLAAWVEPPSMLADYSANWEETRLNPRQQTLDVAELPDGTASVVAWSVGTIGDSGVHLDQVVTLDLAFEAARSWHDILQESIRPFAELLAFLTVHPVRLTAITLRPEGADERDPSISLHLPLVQAGSNPTRSVALPRSRMLSCRLQPLMPFADLVPRWFELLERLRVTVGMLTLPLRTPFLYDENRFLTAFWSAESLHGELFEVHQLAPEKHAERVAAIVNAAQAAGVDPAMVGWAKAVLESRNDKPLRQRVDELLERSGEVGRRIVAAQPKFVGNLTGTRGPLSHSGSGGKLKTPDRYFHAEALRWVIRTCLLLELGADPDRVQKVVLSREQFTWVLKHLAGEQE